MPQPSSSNKNTPLLVCGIIAAVIVTGLMFVGFNPFQNTSTTSKVAPSYGGGMMGQSAGREMGLAVGAPAMAPEMITSYAPAPMPPTETAAHDDVAVEPRIIKTAELSLRVADAPKTMDAIQALVATKNGFIEASSINDTGTGPRSAWLTLRVPVRSFDALLNELKSTAVLVLNESVHGQEVTAEFIDLEADLNNARAEEASYLEIMKRSGKIEETLMVAQRLADVRGRIERLEGRKRYLSNRTDLATISVSLTEETRIELPTRTWKPFEVLKQSLQDLVESLQSLINQLIRATVAIIGLFLPILLLISLVLYAGWKLVAFIVRRIR